jgi:hypothetical protein
MTINFQLLNDQIDSIHFAYTLAKSKAEVVLHLVHQNRRLHDHGFVASVISHTLSLSRWRVKQAWEDDEDTH